MIISGFPGIGKTTFAKKYPNLAIDLESSDFHYRLSEFRKQGLNPEQIKGLKSRIARKNWEQKYAKTAIEMNKKYKFVFISGGPKVINTIKKIRNKANYS